MASSQAGELPAVQPNDPDGPLVLAVLNGDHRAFEQLVERLQTRVFRFVLKQVRRPEEAEDLTQETFLEVFRKLANFRGASRFSTWVMGIALNLARNHRRKAPEYRFDMAAEDDVPETADSAPSPHQSLETKAFAGAVQEALSALPDDVREAVVLVSLDGLSYEEAAAIAETPTGTMKTRVFRGRKMMREAMARKKQDVFLETE